MTQVLTSVTPVLSSKVGYLTDVTEQIATLVRFIIMNPGWISSLWEKHLISFRKMSAQYEHDRAQFAAQLSSAVEQALIQKFRDYQFDCSFKTSDYDSAASDGRYTIGFNIFIYPPTSVTEAQPGLVAGSININPIDNTIELKYDNSVTAAML